MILMKAELLSQSQLNTHCGLAAFCKIQLRYREYEQR